MRGSNRRGGSPDARVGCDRDGCAEVARGTYAPDAASDMASGSLVMGPPLHAVAVGVVQASAGGPRAGVVCLGMRVPAGGGQYLEAAGEFVLVWGGVARWARLGYDDVGVGERGRTEAAGDRGPCRGSRGGCGR